ncbi:MAG: alpha/beta fold hydrolase [Actinobacteria bacterium]|nr:alpha/beta fold hydrolase [Actinomycetota bacterium]
MTELIRASTVLPADREPFKLLTSDGLNLVAEIARPLKPIKSSSGTLVMLHPLPTAGGMMDSHIFRKAAARLPELADLNILRFNSRGTESEAGRSDGNFENGDGEIHDVQAAIDYAATNLGAENLWIVGWSFGTDLALRHARDPRVKGLILLSPPLRTSNLSDLQWWANDGRPVIALVPEFDDYLKPKEAVTALAPLTQIEIIPVDGAKHLWVGEPYVYRVLNEITKIVNPAKVPLPTEY